MLENYEEINLDLILEKAGLFRTEFEIEEFDAILYDKETKELLEELFSYNKEIVNLTKEATDDINNDYLAVHRKFIESILRIKNKINDESYKKQINKNKIDYKVERLLREADLLYILNKYLKNEPISEELLYIGTFDYYLNFIVETILENYENDNEIPEEIKRIISNRLEILNKYLPKE